IIASDRREMLLAFIRGQESEIALIAGRPELRRLVADNRDQGIDQASFRDRTAVLLADAAQNAHGVGPVWVTNADGQVIASSEPALVGQDYSEDATFAAGLL